jgi:hypothetical protein
MKKKKKAKEPENVAEQAIRRAGRRRLRGETTPEEKEFLEFVKHLRSLGWVLRPHRRITYREAIFDPLIRWGYRTRR